MPGTFTISLDFELHWGVRDHSRVEDYPELDGVHLAVNTLLDLFSRRGIEATWAAVGLLMLDGLADAKASSPTRRPQYEDPRLSAYQEFAHLPGSTDPHHFAPELVRKIVSTPGQELGTHTFSHYYCLEPGESVDDFAADLETALSIAESRFGTRPRSIVFPRNQVCPPHLDVCRSLGITCFRGVQRGWMHGATAHASQNFARRGLRLADSYLPLSAPGVATIEGGLVNLPASAFLRPFSPRLASMDGLRQRRIADAMRATAQRGGLFHLWWHPHNFGRNLGANLEFLCAVLDVFDALRTRYGMQSRSMGGAADDILGPQQGVA